MEIMSIGVRTKRDKLQEGEREVITTVIILGMEDMYNSPLPDGVDM